MFHHLTVGVAAAILAISPAVSVAEHYPTKPVRFVAPFAPGGPVDLLARLIGNELSRAFGQQLVVDNRPGANGIIGTDIVAKAPPDGYTILLGNVGPIAINISLYKNLPYHPLKDFAPVSMVARSPQILVAGTSLPVKSVDDLVRLAKSRPGRLSYGTAGIGSATHLSMELFKSSAGRLDIVHVPYKGVAPALADLLAGQIPLVMSNIVPVRNLVSMGKLKGLAVTSRERSRALPQVPTMIESGLPGFEAIVWFGVLAPAGTPKGVITRLDAEIARAQSLPKISEHLSALGSEVWRMSSPAFAAYIKSEVAKWQKVVRDTKVTLH